MFLKLYWIFSVSMISISMIECEAEPSIKVKHGRGIINQQALLIYSVSVTQCINEFLNRPGCVSISYNRKFKRCEIINNIDGITSVPFPGMVFS